MNRKDTYFKVYRSLLEHEIWLKEPFTRGQAWVDLIGMANWGETEKIHRGRLQRVERGQIQTSLKTIADRWHWSIGRVRRYFSLLSDMGMVQTHGNAHGMTITLENYALFQDDRHANEHADGIVDEHVGGIVGGTQNKNNIKNNKKKEQLCFDADGNPHISIVDESCIVDAQSKNPEGEFFTDENGNEYFIPMKGGA